jgi:glycosyltransferase involved in cell wall biosynthesis
VYSFLYLCSAMLRAKLHILQTCFSRSWGGLEIQALEEALQLHLREHHVWLAAPSQTRLISEAKQRGLQTLSVSVQGYFHPAAIWKLGRFIKRKGVEIIHCQLSKDIATVVPAMKLSGRRIPVVLSKRMGSYIVKKDVLHRFTYAHVSKVLAISSVIQQNVLDTTPMAKEHVITLHHGVDTELFSLKNVRRTSVRAAFGFSEDTIIIGFVGRFSPGKGHEEFLLAAAELSQQHHHARFVIVGEASHGEEEYERKIREMAKDLGIGHLVTFAGYRRDIPDVMAAFDIFAFPSHAEAFGAVLIEAMAMERPVVSTNCDGVLDIVVDGKTGLYVNPRRADELAAALKQLVVDPQLRQALGKAGRQRVLELFDQRKQIDRLEGIYYDLLDGR